MVVQSPYNMLYIAIPKWRLNCIPMWTHHHLPGKVTSRRAWFWIQISKSCASAFSTDGRRSERLPSDCNDWVTLLLGRMTGRCRSFLWKKSSFPGPKCVWKPLLARMLFYSVSKCFATLHELTDWHHPEAAAVLPPHIFSYWSLVQ